MSIIPAFTEAQDLERIAINLFHGWGYNFYRLENQLRADDQLIRAKVGWLLGLARSSIVVAESDYRRAALPPPSRTKPRPDPEAVAAAQRLERLSGAIGALAGRIQAAPVPENDRMTQRYRAEADGLATLILSDQQLVGQAEILRATLADRPAAWIIDHAADIEATLAALDASLKERQAILLA